MLLFFKEKSVMISKVLNIIKDEAGKYFSSKINALSDKEFIHLASLVDLSGKFSIPTNSIGLTLLNIEQDKRFSKNIHNVVKMDNKIGYTNPPINLNLDIIFTANFNDYQESLKAISYIISCFQTKSVFTQKNTPELDPSIPKVSLELNTKSFEDQHYIWGMMGTHYLPSVIYQIKMISIQEHEVLQEGQRIMETSLIIEENV